MTDNILISGSKAIIKLPKGLFFIMDSNDNFFKVSDFANGLGHEPFMMQKMKDFMNENDTYIEVGANYGDFTLQASLEVGINGKVYAFEPGKKVYDFLSKNIILNDLSNIIVENMAVLDEDKEISFVETLQEDNCGSLGSYVSSSDKKDKNQIKATSLDSYFKNKIIDIIRLDAEGSECNVLRGADKILDASKDVKIFIEWQVELIRKYESDQSILQCLDFLEQKGFIFLDTFSLNKEQNYYEHQIHKNYIINNSHLEFLAIRPSTLNKFNNNANINQQYEHGATALFLAVQDSKYEVAEALLKAGANPNIGADNGAYPIHMAIGENNPKMVELLLNYGANTEKTNSKNVTALYIASYLGYNEIVKLLLDAGANMLFAVNGVNCLRIAAKNNHQETFALLASYFKPEYGFTKEAIQNIAYYALVKDEEDVIFENLVWHFALGFRKFVIMDNMSSDNTLEVITKFKNLTKNHALVVILNDPEVLYYQGEKATASYYFIRSIWPEVKWVFPTDADEFWFSREKLDQTLERIPENHYIKTYSYRYHPTIDFDNNEQSNFYQKLYLRDYSPHVMHKNIIQTRDDIAISVGNHWINKKENFDESIPYIESLSDDYGIYMYEYYLRSPKQTISKYTKVMKSLGDETVRINPVLNHFDNLIKNHGLERAGEIMFNEYIIDNKYAINDPLPIDLAFNIFNDVIA